MLPITTSMRLFPQNEVQLLNLLSTGFTEKKPEYLDPIVLLSSHAVSLPNLGKQSRT